jgi:hypothetical protein
VATPSWTPRRSGTDRACSTPSSSLERAARTGTAADAGRAELADQLGAALLVRFGEQRQAGVDPDAADPKRSAECFRTACLLSEAADPLRSRRRLKWAIALVNAFGDDEASATGVEMLCTAIAESETPEKRRFLVEVLAGRLAYDVPVPLPDAAFVLARATVDRIAATSRPTDADRSELLAARLAVCGALYARDDPAAGESAIALAGVRIDAAATPSWLDGLAELLVDGDVGRVELAVAGPGMGAGTQDAAPPGGVAHADPSAKASMAMPPSITGMRSA